MARLVYLIYHMLILYLHGCWSSRPPPLPPSSPLSSSSPALPSSASTETSTQSTGANKVVSVKINCTRELFNIKLDMIKPFKGIIFAKDFLDECRSKGE